MKQIRKIVPGFVWILSLILTTSCGGNDTHFTNLKGVEFNIGQVYDSVKVIAEQSISYAIYFPKGYNKKTPVLFLLDPHADGSLPVNKYASLADKYNYILVGSNNSKNGLLGETSLHYIKSTIGDVKSRFEFDQKRMFIGGFSGGAKMALIFAEQMPEIIGAVACGGSLPIVTDKEPTFYFAGIVGNRDFNYLEMRQTYSLFDKYGFDYTANVFNGKHEWPPIASFEVALIGFDIYSAKLKRKDLSDKYLDQVTQQINDSVALYEKKNLRLDEYETYQQGRRWLYGLKPVIDIQKAIATLTQTPEFNQQLTNRQKAIQGEVTLRGEFVRAIEQRDFAWWTTEVTKIKENTTDNDRYLVKQRLLSYISMASFMLIKNDLNDNMLDDAFDKIKIYELVDPENPDVYLMYAKYYLLENDLGQMKNSFKKAQDKGFVKADAYAADSDWTGLLNHPEIKALL